MSKSKPISFILPFFVLWMCCFISGCIRLSGSAGYAKFENPDESPKTKQVGFDTDDILYPNRAKGSIALGENV